MLYDALFESNCLVNIGDWDFLEEFVGAAKNMTSGMIDAEATATPKRNKAATVTPSKIMFKPQQLEEAGRESRQYGY